MKRRKVAETIKKTKQIEEKRNEGLSYNQA